MSKQNNDETDLTDEDFKALKTKEADGVDDSKEQDETDDSDDQHEDVDSEDDTEDSDDQIDNDSEEDSEEESDDDQIEDDSDEDEDSDTFTKKFPQLKGDSPEEYAKSLEGAYDSSTTEAMKWKKLYEDSAPAIAKAEQIIAEAKKKGDKNADDDAEVLVTPETNYVRSQMEADYTKTYEEFNENYPQAKSLDEDGFKKLEAKVKLVSANIQQEEKRLPTLKECLDGAAELLGWDKQKRREKVDSAVKDRASQSRSNSVKKKSAKSTVTKAQIVSARGMFPGMSDSDIAKELEPYT